MRDLTDFPRNGLLCIDCHQYQYETPGGVVCVNGHGGAPGVTPEDAGKKPLPPKQHPRYGYCVALFFGQRTDFTGRVNGHMLLEIYETYNVSGVDNTRNYHYRAYDLDEHKAMEVKTIGYIGYVPGAEEPPRIVQGFFPHTKWRKLR